MVDSVIVIVNYNGFSDTIDCLRSIDRLSGFNWSAILIDNGSTDNSFALIRNWLDERRSMGRCEREPVSFTFECFENAPVHLELSNSKLFVIKSIHNLGFAGANNLALKMIMDAKWDMVWFLNNDTIVDAGAGRALLKKIKEGNRLGLVGSTLVYAHDNVTLQGVGVSYNQFTTRGKQILNGKKINQLHQFPQVDGSITYPIGASMAASRDFVCRTGLMSEDYFLYFEEMDWALRGRRISFDVAWARDSIVYHKEGGSIGTSTTGRPSDKSIYYMHRSLLIFYAKFYPYLCPVAILRCLFNWSRFVLNGDLAASNSVALGFLHFISSRRPEREKVRL